MRLTIALFYLEPCSTFNSQGMNCFLSYFTWYIVFVTIAHRVLFEKYEERQFGLYHCIPVACRIYIFNLGNFFLTILFVNLYAFAWGPLQTASKCIGTFAASPTVNRSGSNRSGLGKYLGSFCNTLGLVSLCRRLCPLSIVMFVPGIVYALVNSWLWIAMGGYFLIDSVFLALKLKYFY